MTITAIDNLDKSLQDKLIEEAQFYKLKKGDLLVLTYPKDLSEKLIGDVQKGAEQVREALLGLGHEIIIVVKPEGLKLDIYRAMDEALELIKKRKEEETLET